MRENNPQKLCINKISKSFGKKQILDEVTFEVASGECIGIIGANGCGKTTLFNIIASEIKPSSGNVYIEGFGTNEKLTKILGYIPQENPLLEDLSVKDNLKLWYCDSTMDMEKELSQGVLFKLGINTFLTSKVKHLSGGMKKRLSIGIALANCPKFLILDEPGAALDLVAKNIIRDYLSEYKSQNGGIIIATHDEEDLSICDKLFSIKNGKLFSINPTLRGSKLIEKII